MVFRRRDHDRDLSVARYSAQSRIGPAGGASSHDAFARTSGAGALRRDRDLRDHDVVSNRRTQYWMGGGVYLISGRGSRDSYSAPPRIVGWRRRYRAPSRRLSLRTRSSCLEAIERAHARFGPSDRLASLLPNFRRLW